MDFTKRYIVTPGTKVKLDKYDPNDTAKVKKKEARNLKKANLKRLSELQYLLYAEHKRAVLIVLQAMDAGGKDGTIRHVIGPLNPQGCPVTSFKAPTQEELDHDFLWRIHEAVPGKGEVGIFNRSHYEDVLIVRVHDLVPREVWSKRYDQINAFEERLAEEGVHILKFFLHISKDEQAERFQRRLDRPDKHWKANPADFAERKLWDDYLTAYNKALTRCSTWHAPWFVIPANKKWFRNLAVSQILVEQFGKLDMAFPEPAFDISKLKVE